MDVPDDFPREPTTVAPRARKYKCEQPVLNQGGAPYPCTAPARWRATATERTDQGEWVAGFGNLTPPVKFKIGETRNCCGTHRTVLKRRRWDIEALPE